MYIKRKIEEKIKDMISKFPVVLITGPRQVGKTTVLYETIQNVKGYNYVTLDDPMIRSLINDDPMLFLQRHKAPLIIDEIQYGKGLLPYIKMIVDESNMKDNENSSGMYILTGSQMFRMMRDVSESLSGRVGVLNLYGLTVNEINSTIEKSFLPTYDYIIERYKNYKPDINDVFKNIFRGSMPKLYVNNKITESEYFSSYVATYLERDIRDLITIKDENKFFKFLSNIAVRTGQELIYEKLARTSDIDTKTAKSWISILESSGILGTVKK